MAPVRLKPADPRSRVKHSTTEPLCSLIINAFQPHNKWVWPEKATIIEHRSAHDKTGQKYRDSCTTAKTEFD